MNDYIEVSRATKHSWKGSKSKTNSYTSGWNDCKDEVLKILNRPYSANINDMWEDRIKKIREL